MNELINNIRSNFITDIDNGNAVEIKSASFTQGDEDEIITKFYRLWGRTIREVYNRRNTKTRFFWVDGDDLDMFNAHYPS